MPKKITTTDFIKQARNAHNDMYDYTLSDYHGQHVPVIITCGKHGDFKVRPNNHVRGRQGCPLCGSGKKRTTADFVTLAKEVHGDLYDYSLSNYMNATTKVIIGCCVHGSFSQTPDMHCFSNQQGCPKCKASKGERQIYNTLLELAVTEFICEKMFTKCINPKTELPLRFDFYIPHCNLLIEYDGQQHFKPTKFSNSMSDADCNEAFDLGQQLDNIKTTFAVENNIRLLRIPFNEYGNIKQILIDNI